MDVCKILFLLLCGFTFIEENECRAVNISENWTLPQEGFSVFYRFFRDKISWFEADAVCQFHHANLVTVENGLQFDATRAFLKELDVTEPVWIGLMRPQNAKRFTWTNSKLLDTASGYWAESLPILESPLCAVIDPVRDFRWHSLRCGGPETAAFLCEMNVPDWAIDCEIRAMPSLTVQYMSNSGTIQLSRDCGEAGTRHMTCKGKQEHDDIIKQLICLEETSPVSEINNNILTSQGTVILSDKSNQKVISEIMNILSKNIENNIEKNAKKLNNGKIFQNISSVEHKLDKDEKEIFIKGNNDKQKPIEKKLNKKDIKNTKYEKDSNKKKMYSVDELMLGDEPMKLNDISTTKVPYEEMKSTTFNMGLNILDITTSQLLTFDLQNETEIEDILSTTIINNIDGRSRRGTDVEHATPTSFHPITITDQSTQPKQIELVKNKVVEENEGLSLYSTMIPFTKGHTETFNHENAMIGSGHPIHIPQSILNHYQDSTIKPHRTTLPHPVRTTQKNIGSDDHFIPPMLLVKAQFTSTKSHIDLFSTPKQYDVITTNKHEIDELTEISDPYSSLTTVSYTTKTNFKSTPEIIVNKDKSEKEISEKTNLNKTVIKINITEPEHMTSTVLPIETSTIQDDTKVETEDLKSSITTLITEPPILSIEDSLFINKTPVKLSSYPVNVTGSDSSDDSTTVHYNNNFSNIENFQPYRPNRHRVLTQPDSSHQSVIKKILG